MNRCEHLLRGEQDAPTLSCFWCWMGELGFRDLVVLEDGEEGVDIVVLRI